MQTTQSTSPSASPAAPAAPPRQRLLLALALAIFAVAALVLWFNQRRPAAVVEAEGQRPLLRNDAQEFHDEQVGVRFTPPPNWSMQGRTTEAPNVRVAERSLVKFKRLIPGQAPAWLRVYVGTAPRTSIGEAVKKRDPGPGWSSPTAPQGLSINGLPAAKVVYRGMYNGVQSQREVVGVVRGDDVFWFIPTYAVGDSAARDQTAQAISSIILQR